MNTTQLLIAPIFIHVLLVTYVGISTIRLRIATVMSGETKLKDIALDNSKWPAPVKQFSNNFDNQFDVPTVWYALCGLIVATGKVDMAFVVLSWLFVATRIIHSLIHTGSNSVRFRMYAFLSGYGTLAAMWAWFAYRLLLIG